MSEEDQPLYIDIETESIKCKWCGLFKGSIEARVINQHSRSSKAHLKERKKRLNPEETAKLIEMYRSNIYKAIRYRYDLSN